MFESIRRAFGLGGKVSRRRAALSSGAGVEPVAPAASRAPPTGYLVVDLAARLHSVRELVHHIQLCDQCQLVTRIPPPPLGLCGVGAVLLGEMCWLWRAS